MMKKAYYLFVLVVILLCSFTRAAQLTDDIAHTVNGIDIPIKILTPSQGSGPFPVIYYVRGGGWNGEVPPAVVPARADFLSDELGLIFVGLSYRCERLGTFQDAMQDIRASINWFEARASEFNADITMVGLMGGSAGTPLSSLLAQEMPTCKTYVGFYGVYDFLNNQESIFPREEKFTEYGLATEEQKRTASAFYNLRPNPPATLLFHGQNDILTHPSQSRRFADQLKEHGAEAEAIIYPNINHGFYRPVYPAEFKDATLRITELYTEYLTSTTIDIAELGSKIDTMVDGYFSQEVINPESILGKWKRRNETLVFKNDKTGVIYLNGRSRPFTYQIDDGLIVVNKSSKKTVFYMMRNERFIYTIAKDRRKLGTRLCYVKQTK